MKSKKITRYSYSRSLLLLATCKRVYQMFWGTVFWGGAVIELFWSLNNNNNDRLTAFDPGQPG